MPPLLRQAAPLLLLLLRGTNADSALTGWIFFAFDKNTTIFLRDCQFGRLAQLGRPLGGHPKLGRRLGVKCGTS